MTRHGPNCPCPDCSGESKRWRDLRERPERCACGARVYQWDGRGAALDAQGWPHGCWPNSLVVAARPQPTGPCMDCEEWDLDRGCCLERRPKEGA